MRTIATLVAVTMMGLAGCTMVTPTGSTTPGAAATGTTTPAMTPAAGSEVGDSGEITDTSNLTGTEDMTNLGEITGTGDVTIIGELTDTEEITDTSNLTGPEDMTNLGEITGTGDVTITDELTNTENVDDTEGMTDTQGMGDIADDASIATAELMDAEGQSVGFANFIATEGAEDVAIEVEVIGLDVQLAGPHGIHIHTTGACTPDFTAAGPHFNPTDMQHGLENPNGPHAGDIPNIEIDGDGNAFYYTTTNMISLGVGEDSLLDTDGSAIIIHANPDDLVTDPSGNSGDRIVCGVITPVVGVTE